MKTRFLLSSERVVSGPEDSPRQANIAGKKHLLSLPNKIKDTENTRLQMFHRSDMWVSSMFRNQSQMHVCEVLGCNKEPRAEVKPKPDCLKAKRKAIVRLTYLHAADFYCLPTLLTITKSLCTLAVAQHSYTYCGLLSKETCTTSTGVLPKRPELQFPLRRPILGYDNGY